MAHVRTQCRDAIATALAATATAGANVVKNVVYDISRLTLPAIGVSEGDETREPVTMPQPRIYAVSSEFDVTIYAESNDDCEAALDAIAVEIEQALAMPIDGPWKELTHLASGVRLEPADKVRGRRILRYRANYRIRENAPETPL